MYPLISNIDISDDAATEMFDVFKKALPSYDFSLPLNTRGFRIINEEYKRTPLHNIYRKQQILTARKWLERSLKCNANYDWATYNEACTYALMGNSNEAIRLLNEIPHEVGQDQVAEVHKHFCTEISFCVIRKDVAFRKYLSENPCGNLSRGCPSVPIIVK